VIYRLPMLRARHELDSWMSKEAAFLANNWILLFSAMFILFATLFPTLTEAINGERLTVGPPFFNRWMVPIGLVLLLLTGIGPLLAWRKSTVANLKEQFMWPVLAGLVTGGVLVALGVRVWSSGICFALAGFVTGTLVQEFVRGGNVRRGMTGTDLFTAIVGLVSRNRRRYGGYIVHAGVVLIFLGFAGEGFSTDQQLLLKPGQEATVGDYVIHLDAIRVTDDGQKQMITGHITVKNASGEVIDQMRPARWYFRKHEEEPTTEVAIHRTFAEDLYIVMPAFEIEEQTASVEVHINPLVNWVWFGFGILAVGTAITLLPEASLSFAMAKLPAEAVTASLLLLSILLSSGAAFAQHVVPNSQDPRMQISSPEARKVANRLACWCGGCSKLPVGQCACAHCAPERAKIDVMLKEGKSEQQIVDSYVATYGGAQILSEPPNSGSGRIAWAMPVVVGAAGFLTVAYLAMRWSRRPAVAGMPAGVEDPDMAARLDDELRELD
jgi:cytochrome c-type biogenesis protein CcmF